MKISIYCAIIIWIVGEAYYGIFLSRDFFLSHKYVWYRYTYWWYNILRVGFYTLRIYIFFLLFVNGGTMHYICWKYEITVFVLMSRVFLSLYLIGWWDFFPRLWCQHGEKCGMAGCWVDFYIELLCVLWMV